MKTSKKSTPISKEKHVSRDCHERKKHSTFAENFPLRSRSADISPSNLKTPRDFRAMLEYKDKQMESLVQRVISLYKYNNLFAKENKKLHLLLQDAESRGECKTCQKYRTDKEELVKINNNLENDISMMKILVYRLNVQIDSYQQKTSSLNDADSGDISKGKSDDRKCVLQWGPLNSETLGPLLNSYEEMLKEKDDLIQEHENEIKHFTGELKKVIDENLQLQKEYDALKRSSQGCLEMKTRLQTQLGSLKSNLDVQQRRADLAKEKLLEVIQCYEQKTQTLSLDLEHVQNAYTRCKQDLISMKNTSQNKPDISHDSLQECKQLLEELKAQHLKERNDLFSKSEELKTQNTALLRKNEELTINLEKLVKQFNTERNTFEELKHKIITLQRISERLKKSRDRLKARLKIALQWAQKLEQKHTNYESSWEAVKQLEIILKHKEAQIKGLHSRYLSEMDRMKQMLQQKEETIKNILKSKIIT